MAAQHQHRAEINTCGDLRLMALAINNGVGMAVKNINKILIEIAFSEIISAHYAPYILGRERHSCIALPLKCVVHWATI